MPRIAARSAGVLALITLLSLGGTPALAATAHQTGAAQAAHEAQAASARLVHAAGDFTAVVDFPSLVTRDVGWSTCEFRVTGTLAFTGTLEGRAAGTTTALIDAPCSQALRNPPGTFGDVFRFEGRFTGTVDGSHARGRLDYAGVTRPGGAIHAAITLWGGHAKAALHTVKARIGVGGAYRGVAFTTD